MTPTAGWLLLVVMTGQGGASITQVGPFWPNEASCKSAQAGVEALIKSRAAEDKRLGAPFAYGSSSLCVIVGNPTVSSEPRP